MRYAIAIDIGTTNIEAALVAIDENGGDCGKKANVMSTILRQNVNRKFGRDVMTRITQAQRGNLHEMSTELRAQLSDMVKELAGEIDISKIAIACNTTMTHILLEEDCHNLGVFPFSPVHTELTNVMSTDIGLLDDRAPVPVTILPGFSAYVGGDILSGVLSLDLFNKSGRTLLIDLGTNGEMVYHDADSCRILVTSTAAGPAFELAGRAKATEIIEGIAYLKRQGIIDRTGLFTDEYFESGYRYKGVNITQALIRDVQTAKAAIRAGIEILLSKASQYAYSGLNSTKKQGDGNGVSIDNVYISGAFGDNLNAEDAIAIGMIPASFRGRITPCGNTSLSGAIRYCTGMNEVYIPECDEIYLSTEADFNDIYIEYMNL